MDRKARCEKNAKCPRTYININNIYRYQSPMSKQHNFGTLASAALLLLGTSAHVNAANDNATMLFSANIVAATCSVGTTHSQIDFGNYLPEDFKGLKAFQPISSRVFTLDLSNCKAVTGAAGVSAGVEVVGTPSPVDNKVFNDNVTQNVGILISELDGNGKPDLGNPILANQRLEMAAGTTTAPLGPDNMNNLQLPLAASLVPIVAGSALSNTDIGQVKSQITFQFYYQ